MNKITSGIDFGTSNSVIGYSKGKGDAKLIKLGKTSLVETSAIFYSFDNGGNPIVGKEGVNEYISGEPGRLITSPKRHLKSKQNFEIRVLGNRYGIVYLVGHIIAEFKKRLEKEVGGEVDSILVGRPVRFHDTNDNIDKLAENRLRDGFERAGFKHIEFQFEPIAAFNAYSSQHPELNTGNKNILVIDLGGGTSDFSLINIQNGVKRILGNTGVYVGGDDLDETLMLNNFSKYLGKGAVHRLMNGGKIEIPNTIFSEFSDKSKLVFFKNQEKLVSSLMPLLLHDEDIISLGRVQDILQDLSLGYLMHSLVEKAKISLSGKEQVSIDFNMFKNKFSSNLTREDFEKLIQGEIDKIKRAILEIFLLTGLSPGNIDGLIMNGGTSYIPIVRNTISHIFGKGKILDGNDLSSVGYGLTLESYERFNL